MSLSSPPFALAWCVEWRGVCGASAYRPQEHRHSFVRKNAVFTVYTIYQDHEHLIPDAPELLDTFLAAESDSTCKRNAFVALCNISQPTAVRYLLSVIDQISSMDELMQMAVIELIRKEARNEGGHRVSSPLL